MRSTMGAVVVLALSAVLVGGRPAPVSASSDNPQVQNQTRGHRPAAWQARFERFSTTLNLTQDQQDKIRPLFEDEAEQVKTISHDKSLSKQDKKAKVQEIHENTQNQVKSFLTPDQLEKWGAFQEQGRDRAQDRRQAQNSDRSEDSRTWRSHSRSGRELTWQQRYARLNKALSFTPDQQDKIKPIFQQAGAQIKAVNRDKSLSQEDKAERIRGIHETTASQVKPLLTPDQLEKWGSLQEEARDRAQDQAEWQKHNSASRDASWQERFERFSKTLSLTEDQQEKIKPIFANEAEQMKAVANDQSMSKEDKAEKVKGIRESCMNQVKALLTPDQLEKLGAIQEESRDQAQDRSEQKNDSDEKQDSK